MALGRSREIAVRAALGASRFRLLRGLLRRKRAAGRYGRARRRDAGDVRDPPDCGSGDGRHRVARRGAGGRDRLLFAGVATLAAACLFGLLPALRASRDLNGALAAGTRTTHDRGRVRARSALVAVEISLAVALLVPPGCLGAVSSGSCGRRSGSILAASRPSRCRCRPPPTRTSIGAPCSSSECWPTVAARPDVEAAGAIFGLPLTDFTYAISGYQRDAEVLSPDDQGRFSLNVRVVTPAFFRALGVPIVAGRDFGPAIGAALRRWRSSTRARRGCTFRGLAPPESSATASWSARGWAWAASEPVERSSASPATFAIWGRDRPRGRPSMSRMRSTRWAFSRSRARARGARRSPSCASIRGGRVDPTVPVFRERTMEQFASRLLAQPRLYLTLLAVFAVSRGRAGGDRDLRGHGAERRGEVARDWRADGAWRDPAGRRDDDHPRGGPADGDRRRRWLHPRGPGPSRHRASDCRRAAGRRIDLSGRGPGDARDRAGRGVVPARRAAKVDPVGSLRAE